MWHTAAGAISYKLLIISRRFRFSQNVYFNVVKLEEGEDERGQSEHGWHDRKASTGGVDVVGAISVRTTATLVRIESTHRRKSSLCCLPFVSQLSSFVRLLGL